MVTYSSIDYRLSIRFTVKDKFHDGVDGFVTGADAQQTDDILVVEAFHHFGLAEEIELLFDGGADFERLDSHRHLSNMQMLRHANEHVGNVRSLFCERTRTKLQRLLHFKDVVVNRSRSKRRHRNRVAKVL